MTGAMQADRRRVSIFGATGSIGQSTLDLIARAPSAYEVVALTGGANVDRLAADAIRLKAGIAVTAYPERLHDLRARLAGSGVEAAAGEAALLEAADRPADWIMSAIVGAAGLPPGLRALRHGTVLALANKESLVCAGPILMAEAARHGATILPVDSEHSAVFQALRGEDIATVEKVVITASGGGLRDWSLARLPHATPAEAGAHPNWDMGQRITIDSASMFNKAMELIETHEFFGLPPERIETIVHPQSLIHALVQFCDGAMMAHLGAPDMRHAIGHALHWPTRQDLPVARLDLAEIARLDFAAPDPARYPALALAERVMATGGLAGAAFNAAKEVALDLFIGGRLPFTEMAPLVERVLDRMAAEGCLEAQGPTLDMVLQADRLARDRAADLAGTYETPRRAGQMP
ncbi:1-deoxy-D-xylulose-5-phosphate reductoisomerase [uncultured Jannaschia sp.]|uniref:1-deoxy-D-xylulose-5-phosphate reductoisomerase n=1 Tax=uncultured Jannaschia sp. TaxID=293347 RepID=UPI002616B1EF|nr:1-deoxy-D-xylulose-5-phosphate reductoisomerase [uncultured Jannaschia sp.]